MGVGGWGDKDDTHQYRPASAAEEREVGNRKGRARGGGKCVGGGDKDDTLEFRAASAVEKGGWVIGKWRVTKEGRGKWGGGGIRVRGRRGG